MQTFTSHALPDWLRGVTKRCLDVVVAALVLALFAPLMPLIAVAVWGKLGRPVLHSQPRPGRHGRLFRFHKFRTMTEERDPQGKLLCDERRLTPFGRWLRRTSLDEIPQLFNVLAGDMSLVGPRPLLVEYLPLYSPEQSRRHEVRPGITGWAQVNGRNNLSWEEKFALDTWYVDHQSFLLDLRILWMTLAKVWRSEGINQAGQATMERFHGNSAPRTGRE